MPSILDILTGAGAALDLPGSSIRDVLAGQNPVDQWYKSPFSFEDRTMGRGLLEQYGLLSPNQPGLDMGDVAGFGVEVATDPLGLLLGGGAARAGHRGLLSAAKQSVRNPTASMFGAGEIQRLAGTAPGRLGIEEAAQHWRPWVEGLEAAERDALQIYTGNAAGKINQALRGFPATNVHGTPLDAFDIPGRIRTEHLMPEIRSAQEILDELAPYGSAGLARGKVPRDAMVYRSGQLWGPGGKITPETAPGMVGKTIEEPGFMSTSIHPSNIHYGRADPTSVRHDIMVPGGSQAGYVEELSKYPNTEFELLFPPGSQLDVLQSKQVPLVKMPGANFDPYRWTDEAGRPFPQPGDVREYPQVFRSGPAEGQYPAAIEGLNRVPDEMLTPNWQQHVESGPPQTNVLYRLMQPEGIPQQAPMRRMTAEEMLGQLAPRVATEGDLSRRTGRRLFGHALERLFRGEPLTNDRLMNLMAELGIDLSDLTRSVPR